MAGILAVALAVAICAGGWWVSGRFASRVEAAAGVADHVAAALAAGQVPPGTIAGEVAGGAPPPADLSGVLAGMGRIPHEVSVASLGLGDGGERLAIGLRHSWRVQPDKAPWVYETTGLLRWTDRGWQLLWSPDIVAPGLTAQERLEALRLQPTRGRIVGAGGVAFEPPSTLAAPLLGIVGAATKEQVDAAGGRLKLGDTVGLSGLQASQDARLAGTPGYVVRAVRTDGAGAASTPTAQTGDATGAAAAGVRELHRVDPVAGTDVQVSLDPRVQEAAERTLASTGPPAAVVAIRPSDGHVLAAASGPASQGYSTATLGQYAPGSTFKVVTSEALLAGGLSPQSSVTCSPTTTVDGRGFTNYSDYPSSALGSVTLAVALAQSCNTAMINARDIATPQAVGAAAAVLGLTADPSLGVPAFLGRVPTDVGATEAAAGLIGQGQVLASPLGMATVAASVGAGHTVYPVVVLDGQRQPAGSTASPTAGGTAAPVPAHARGRDGWQRELPRRRAGPAGAGQDGHRRIRHRHPAPRPRLDDRGARQPRRQRLRRGRRQRFDDRRPAARAVPARGGWRWTVVRRPIADGTRGRPAGISAAVSAPSGGY